MEEIFVKYGIDQEWFDRFIIGVDELTEDELKDIDYVIDRIETHLDWLLIEY